MLQFSKSQFWLTRVAICQSHHIPICLVVDTLNKTYGLILNTSSLCYLLLFFCCFTDTNVVEVIIELGDLNDNPPEFPQDRYFIGVSQDASVSTTIITMQVGVLIKSQIVSPDHTYRNVAVGL